MCYGSVDPKYMISEIEQRLKGVAFTADKSEEPGQLPAGGLAVRLQDLFRRITRKEPVHG